MARRRTNEGTVVSLFPFLSILSCVIGTLTLLIAGLTAGAVAAPGANPAEEHAKLITQNVTAKREVTELDRLIAAAVAVANDLEAAKAEHDRLRVEKGEADLAHGEVVRRESRINELKRLIAELEAILQDLQAEIAKLEAELAKHQQDLANADRPVVTLPLDVPGVTRANLQPTFLECNSDGLVLGMDSPEERQVKVATAEIATSEALKAYLKAAQGRADATVICLIRPGGIPGFLATQAVAREIGVKRFAKVPLPGAKPPDLSQFAQPK